MKNSKKLIAKVIVVKTAVKDDTDGIHLIAGKFEALEFPNGLILVEGQDTADWFFEDRDRIGDGCVDGITLVEETSRTETWTTERLLKSIQGSIKDFGEDSVPAKHLELWKNKK